MWFRSLTYVGFLALAAAPALPAAAQEPDRIFDKSTVWRPLTPNDKLVVYGIDDPAVSGVACWYTQPEKGGIKGTLGLAEDVSDISLACRQTGPIAFKAKLGQGEIVFSERRSLIFKSMQIVRGCDAQRNTLIYMVYSDRVIQGSPKNSTSAVPLAPWGAEPAPKCADFVKDDAARRDRQAAQAADSTAVIAPPARTQRPLPAAFDR